MARNLFQQNQNIAVLLQEASSYLEDKLSSDKLATPKLDARILIEKCAALPYGFSSIYPEMTLSDSKTKRLQEWIFRRGNGEPVARILQEKEFWSLEFSLNEDTLIPRPDTEILIETALALFKQKPQLIDTPIIDVGTGSGAILVALLTEIPQLFGYGVDLNFKALLMAQHNAQKHNVSHRSRFITANDLNGFRGPFSMIITNPPYIASSHIPFLTEEVKNYDPLLALDGGEDGLDRYRSLIRTAKQNLHIEGYLVLEIGSDQAESVSDLISLAGFQDISVIKDLQMLDRCIIAHS